MKMEINNFLNNIGTFDLVNKLNINKSMKIILGSSSPRRIELIKEITSKFQVEKPIVDEKYILSKSLEKNKYLGFLKNAFTSSANIALEKARSIYKENIQSLIISADTIVVTDRKILGKPEDKEDAFSMLLSYLGNYHYVVTGVCLYIDENNYDLFYNVSAVKFIEKTDFAVDYIEKYVLSGRPIDKAGSYNAQELSTSLVEAVFGDYNNIVGLPVTEIRRRLNENFS